MVVAQNVITGKTYKFTKQRIISIQCYVCVVSVLSKLNWDFITCIACILYAFMNCFNISLTSAPSSYIVIPKFTFNLTAQMKV